jgi:hypothetical protein
MERFCRRCTSRASATEDIELKDAKTPDACAWCKKQMDAKMLAETHLCTTCSGLRIKCTKCSKTLKKSITKPLSAFSFERLLQCKEQRTLSSRAKCLKCDDADPKSTENLRAYHWQQASYNCSKCEKALPPANFTPAALRTLELQNQIYLAICDDCKAKTQEGTEASEERLKCEHCTQVLPPSDFSAAMRRRTTGKSTCWACQHPKCSGDGCEARQPIARVGNYTCEKCLYPPCHICKTTARPRGGGSKYSSQNMPEWVCPGCKTNCLKCGRACPEKEPNGRKRKGGIGLCDLCLFPPCPTCGKARPVKAYRYSTLVLPTWTCAACTKQRGTAN